MKLKQLFKQSYTYQSMTNLSLIRISIIHWKLEYGWAYVDLSSHVTLPASKWNTQMAANEIFWFSNHSDSRAFSGYSTRTPDFGELHWYTCMSCVMLESDCWWILIFFIEYQFFFFNLIFWLKFYYFYIL